MGLPNGVDARDIPPAPWHTAEWFRDLTDFPYEVAPENPWSGLELTTSKAGWSWALYLGNGVSQTVDQTHYPTAVDAVSAAYNFVHKYPDRQGYGRMESERWVIQRKLGATFLAQGETARIWTRNKHSAIEYTGLQKNEHPEWCPEGAEWCLLYTL
jgi:hypothetical protein